MDWNEIQDTLRQASLEDDYQIGVDDESALITADEWEVEIFPDGRVIAKRTTHPFPDVIKMRDPQVKYRSVGTVVFTTEQTKVKIRIRNQ